MPDNEHARAIIRGTAISFALAALVVSLLIAPLPGGLSEDGRRVAVVGLIMAGLWMSEAVPLPATALLPLVLFPVLGIASLDRAAAGYAHPLILLFFGGFALAAAMQRWGLHQRLAADVLSIAGNDPGRQLMGVMAVTAFLSLWISNTATAMLMLPIGLSLSAASRSHGDTAADRDPFPAALMLGIAYAATIGGMGSLIGTPPNALFAAYMERSHGVTINFVHWMAIGLPIAVALLVLAWLLLTRVFFRFGQRTSLVALQASYPPLDRGQWIVTAVLCATALGWLLIPVAGAYFSIPGITDTGIAIAAVFILLVFPSSVTGGRALLTWEDIQSIRWDVLILFGGGLALADGIGATGLAGWIGQQLQGLSGVPSALTILAIMIVIVALGELASNTAVAAISLPVAGAAAIGLGQEPLALVLPVALAASLGFALPVATPPNAIVYGSGAVTAREMLRTGLTLDVVAIIATYVLAMILGPLLFGPNGPGAP